MSSLNENWRGLGRNIPGYDGSTIIDDAPQSGYWHSAIGAKNHEVKTNDLIPGPYPYPGYNYKTDKVELYVMHSLVKRRSCLSYHFITKLVHQIDLAELERK